MFNVQQVKSYMNSCTTYKTMKAPNQTLRFPIFSTPLPNNPFQKLSGNVGTIVVFDHFTNSFL